MTAVVQYPGRSFTKVQAALELIFSASQSSFPKHAECHTAGGVGSGAVVDPFDPVSGPCCTALVVLS
jgi:hypothetical protein